MAKAVLENINKALREKTFVTEDAARNRLPEQVKELARLFVDCKGAEELHQLRG